MLPTTTSYIQLVHGGEGVISSKVIQSACTVVVVSGGILTVVTVVAQLYHVIGFLLYLIWGYNYLVSRGPLL